MQTITPTKRNEMYTTYTCSVIDLIPGVDDDTRADNASTATADTIESAELQAIAGSAVNCNRSVSVWTGDAMTVVKGPYILKARLTRVTS
jgi:hypothetical protein